MNIKQAKYIHIAYHKTKIGEMVIGSLDGKICLLDFRYRRMRSTVDKRIRNLTGAGFLECENEIITKAQKQIDEYLE